MAKTEGGQPEQTDEETELWDGTLARVEHAVAVACGDELPEVPPR
jgi:hypothetical protein